MLRLNLSIEDQARHALRVNCKQTGFDDPIPCLMWSEKTDGSDPGWMVGFWNKADVADEHTVVADGIEFVVEDHYRALLAGKTLVVVAGFFDIIG